MQKKYIVRLLPEERKHLHCVIKKRKGSGQKVRRAYILQKTDADGPNWTDQQIAEAFSCRIKTVENIRQRFVEQGFQQTFSVRKREQPPNPKALNGEQEAKIIAMLKARHHPVMLIGHCAYWRVVWSNWKWLTQLVMRPFDKH